MITFILNLLSINYEDQDDKILLKYLQQRRLHMREEN
jgi:hypothetical protein